MTTEETDTTQDKQPAGAELPAKPSEVQTPEAPPSPFGEIVKPFIDLVHAPRALWGVNLASLLEGMVYFGILGLLGMYFNEYVGLDDVHAGWMVGVLTSGITLSMVFFGGLADKWGVRKALLVSIALLMIGRVFLVAGPRLGLPAAGMGSTIHLIAMGGILLVVLGYGMYQPATYSAVKQFTTPKTAPMAYAMLYAVMNLGGWLPTFISPPIRRAYGIVGIYTTYIGFTALALVSTALLLSRKTVETTIAGARAESGLTAGPNKADEAATALKKAQSGSIIYWLKNHPLADPKFAFFIFCLIPVQTLFAHNWLTLPQYVERAYRNTWIGDHFEAAINFNPILIFILVPIVAAISQKANVYKMMIWGTLVMAAPTFLLALGPSFWTLLGFLIVCSIGEAMWQPRFLQYAAEIAPEGRTAAYMGVAQLPWFLTKMITATFSGWFLQHFCPDPSKGGQLHTEKMWFIYGLIAVSSTVLLVVAKGWLGKDFKTKAA